MEFGALDGVIDGRQFSIDGMFLDQGSEDFARSPRKIEVDR